jgi:hypothetical protein|tara:strand:+ start:1990 stop:3198 length:1209 start_codon:yes stop_codon:yes gene_type:complete
MALLGYPVSRPPMGLLGGNYPMMRPQGLRTPSNQNMMPTQNMMPAPRLIAPPVNNMGGGNAPANNFGFGTSFDDPRTQGILGASMGLLNAGGYTTMPTSFGQNLAQGLSQGMSAYNSAMKNVPKSKSTLIDGGKYVAITAPDGTVSVQKSEIYDDIISREKSNKSPFQVVGGSLLDISNPNDPKVVYERKGKNKTSLLNDGKFLATTSPDGSTTYEKSPLYDTIINEEKAKKEEKKSENKLSGTLQKAETDDIYALETSKNINKDVDKFDKLITDKKLEFGVFDTGGDYFKGLTGFQGEEEINSSKFKSFIQKLRNDSLKLNKGIQTDADAKRVMGELFEAFDSNNSNVIQEKLREIKRINETAIALRKKTLINRRDGQNVKPFDFSKLGNNSDIGYKVVPE